MSDPLRVSTSVAPAAGQGATAVPCSELSLRRGLPLIGSAGCYDAVLAFELETPWTSHLTGSRGCDAALDAVIANIAGTRRNVRLLALEPDGRRDRARVLWFAKDRATHDGQSSHDERSAHDKQQDTFGAFTRREYDVARGDLAAVLEGLAGGGSVAADEVACASGQRDVLVCTHGARDACCGRFGYPLYRELSGLALQAGVAGGPLAGPVRVWRSSHLGGHRFAPTLLDLPSGRMFGRMAAGDAASVLFGGAPLVARLESIYRGRCALPEVAQIVERQLWLEAGPGLEHAVLSWTVESAGDVWSVSLAARCGQQESLSMHARVVLADAQSIETPASCGRDPEAEAPWRMLS